MGGREFKGTRITLVPRNTISEHAVRAILAPYPVGGHVTVFHDPADPCNCVLSTVTHSNERVHAIGGVLFIDPGLLFLKKD